MLRLTKKEAEAMKRTIEQKEKELKNLRLYKGSAYENEGDGFHDNFAFEQAEIKERGLLREIAILQKNLAEATIVEHKPDSSGKVTLGSKVMLSLKFGDEVEEDAYIITGGDGDISQNLISEKSPLAMCIMGQMEGFEGKYSVGSNTTIVKILKVE